MANHRLALKVGFIFTIFIIFMYSLNDNCELPLKYKTLNQTKLYRRPIIIAHRGASGYVLEHTLAAKALAYVMGADYLEQDVLLTKDDVPIIMHDYHLNRISDVVAKFGPSRAREDSNYYPVDFTLAEIKTMSIINGDFIKLKQEAFKISTLQEEIDFIHSMHIQYSKYSQYRVKQRLTPGLHLELKATEFYKNNGKPNLINIVIEMLARYGYKNRDDPIFIQSFNLNDLIYLRTTLNSTLRLIYLLGDKLDTQYVANAAKFVDGLGPPINTLVNSTNGNYLGPSDFYKDARKHNLMLHPWTLRVDDIPTYAKDFDDLLKIFLIDLNVDGVFTDFPDLVDDYMEKNGKFFK